MNESHLMQNIFTNTMADMNWTDIQRLADEDAVVLLPIGVMEEHGPHLCLATDIYLAHLNCLAVQQKLELQGYPSVIAPPFYWGVCQAGRGFIGSFGIRAETAHMLLFDILTSLRDFGFHKVFILNAHGDVEHKIVALNACKDACEQLGISACLPYQDFMTEHLGYTRGDPWFYHIEPSKINVSTAAVPDAHAGDIETATVHAYYPHCVDTEVAKSLPDVALGDNFEAWMFGGQLKQLSPNGYLGAPANFENVDVARNMEDYARRMSDAILLRLNA